MFQNGFQGGTHFEIFDPKEAMNKGNKDKEKFYQQLFKVNAPPHCQKVFDKQLKSYIFDIDGHNTKMQLPRDDRAELGLVQQYIVLQVQVPHSQAWNLEIVVTDTTKTKRRIMLTSSIKQVEKKFFHVKVPIDSLKRGVWLNLCIDVWSFMEAWKGQTFRTLDMIIISSPCKLRKIFLLRSPVDENQEELTLDKIGCQPVPKNVNYPIGFPHENQLMSYRNLTESQYIPEYIDVGASQSLPEEQVQRLHSVFIHSSTQTSKNVAFGQSSSSSSQQKSSGFKKKPTQFQEKSTRGSSVEKGDSYDDSSSLQKQKQTGPKKSVLKPQLKPSTNQDFYEVEENIEGENLGDFENEFQQQDDLNQFQQQSYNDEIDIMQVKQPKSILSKINILEQGKVVQQRPKQVPNENQGSQTGQIVGVNQNLLITNTVEVNRHAKQQQGPLTQQNSDSKKVNPWNKNKDNQPEPINGQQKVQDRGKQSDSKQKKEVRSSTRSPNNFNNLQVKQQQARTKETEYDESNEELIMDVQQTQKKAFLTKGNKLPKPAVRDKNQVSPKQQRVLKIERTTSNNVATSSQLPSPQNYYLMTQKFSTISDPNAFMAEVNYEQAKDRHVLQDEEIEENIEVELTFSAKQELIKKDREQAKTPILVPDINEPKKFTQQGFNKRSLSELKPQTNDSQAQSAQNDDDELEDSLEMPPIGSSYGNNKPGAYSYSQNKWKMKQQDESGTTFTDGFYANQLKKYTEINHRPFTPDYESTSNLGLTGSKVKPQTQPIIEEVSQNVDDQMVEVVYDPVMNCYFDPQTNQYYELKD